MNKVLVFFLLLFPTCCFAQISISGKVLNQIEKKPIANASVFLSNGSIGNNSNLNGVFILNNVKPGKYELVVSIIGFETYHQLIMVGNVNLVLPDIIIIPKTTILNEVKISPKTDPDRGKNFDLFKDEFLGTSDFAKDCKIVNPEVLDLSYDEVKNTLCASSVDFLEIENKALGYKLKYLLTNFKADYQNNLPTVDYRSTGLISNIKGPALKALTAHYEGSVYFEELKGTMAQQRHWELQRQKVYLGSEMHFLRSAIRNEINEENFRVLQLAIYQNPNRPNDSIIEAKIRHFEELKVNDSKLRDSLAYWQKKSKLPKAYKSLLHFPLNLEEIVRKTDQKGVFALGCDGDELLISYNQKQHFSNVINFSNLDSPDNDENTVLQFNQNHAFFDANGQIIDPNSLSFTGAWGRDRIAELLPIDYEVPQKEIQARDTKVEDNIVGKLNDYRENSTVEKVYLHMDKPYYATGDTIYFKAYLTMGQMHQPSNISNVLYVDLINTDNKIDRTIKLQVNEGVAWGDFALADSLPKGSYRVRAYTNWMRNGGDGAYFNQLISIGSIHDSKIPESIVKKKKNLEQTAIDVQFFPEGGVLLNGIKNKIAFKAIGANGLGIDIKGIITDNDNREITEFASTHLGMGYFYLSPQQGKNYEAKVTYNDGTSSKVELPIAQTDRIKFSLNNDFLQNATAKIEATEVYYQQHKGKPFFLLIHSGGVSNVLDFKLDSAQTTLDILKRKLKTGVATATLFSPTGEPLCERLFFIQNNDQLNLAISSEKRTYSTREKVKIGLNVKDSRGNSEVGNFSVSVIDENKVPGDENSENTILSNMLLTSDLKGYIENPNYYFTDIRDQTRTDLDLVMLTHGYRQFEWKQLLTYDYPPISFQKENRLEISGIVKNLLGKPLKNATVSLVAKRDGVFTTVLSDGNGKFKFTDLVFSDTDKFVLQAVNEKGKNKTMLFLDPDKPAPVPEPLLYSLHKDSLSQLMALYLENNRKQQDDIAKYGTIKGKLLKEVFIKAKKPEESNTSNNFVSEQFADQVIHADQMAKGGPFSDRIQGVLHGVRIVRGTSGIIGAYAFAGQMPGALGVSRPMRVILDGVDTDGDLDKMTGLDIESVDVLTSPGTAGAYDSFFIPPFEVYKGGYDGVLVINSKKHKGLQLEDIASIGILPIAPKGFYKAREFYSPKYDHLAENNKRTDLRSTIYWKPDLVTDDQGNVNFEFYNADGTGTYKITIEGIDKNGNLGHRVYRYKVE